MFDLRQQRIYSLSRLRSITEYAADNRSARKPTSSTIDSRNCCLGGEAKYCTLWPSQLPISGSRVDVPMSDKPCYRRLRMQEQVPSAEPTCGADPFRMRCAAAKSASPPSWRTVFIRSKCGAQSRMYRPIGSVMRLCFLRSSVPSCVDQFGREEKMSFGDSVRNAETL
jgi:hypothetical protein